MDSLLLAALLGPALLAVAIGLVALHSWWAPAGYLGVALVVAGALRVARELAE